MNKGKYMLLVFDNSSGEIYYGFNDNLQKLLYDYLTYDEQFFEQFLEESGQDYIDCNVLMDYYEIQYMVLVDLKEGWDDTNMCNIIFKCIPIAFERFKELSELNHIENEINVNEILL